MMPSNVLKFPVESDAAERVRALDVAQSWIVEAPAGSGKTGLLMQRFLKLLGQVEQPEEVLAITFTRKATAELRERVLGQLAAARGVLRNGATAFEAESHALAAAVVARDAAAGWRLLEQPERLQIKTIDAVCASIAGAMPLLAGHGAGRAPVDAPEPLYRLAARRTLLQLGGADKALDAALRTVLLHRDANLQDCETLLARMLASREQWGGLVPLGRELDEATLENEVRPRLERALELVVCAGLTRAAKAMPPDMLVGLSWLAGKLAHNVGYNGGVSPMLICAGRHEPPEERVEHLEVWSALIHLLVTGGGEWRRGFAKNHLGFEIDKSDVARLKEMIDGVREDEALRKALCAVKTLPPARYPDAQWRVAKALFRMLVRALAELKVLFAEQGACDFAEMSIAAKAALSAEDGAAELAGASGVTLKHLLVDEMQDTSAGQYELIQLLTRSWDGSSQTLFLVGDPKQSIYLFRQARVERFLRVVREGRMGDVPLGALKLTANFRSQRGLVEDGFNADFARVFPAAGTGPQEQEDPMALDVPFVRAVAVREATEAEGRTWHVGVLGESERDEADAVAGRAARWRENRVKAEAEAIRAVVEMWRAKPLRKDGAGNEVPWKIAVLARAREHLTPVIAEFKRAGVAYRALEIERLGEQAEVIDVLALTRALLHPADRMAWLAVLHAPWCGLGVADLLAISGGGADAAREEVLVETVWERRGLLSADGRVVLERAWPVLEAAMAGRGRTSVAVHVERTWKSLGGDVMLGAQALENVDLYFEALRAVEGPGGRVDLDELKEKVGRLYARPASAVGAVELLTMHGAKGLEWDVVLVPGMERKSPPVRAELLNWLELDFGTEGSAGAAHVVLAPIYEKGDKASGLYAWLNKVRGDREAAERKRVFYVASTRAREELHLFAAAKRKSGGELCAESGSLLDAAWGAAEEEFAPLAVRRAVAAPVENVLTMLKRSVEDVAGVVLEMAAGAENAGATERPPVLRRLPVGYAPRARFAEAAGRKLAYAAAGELRTAASFARPEGSFTVRAFGNVVHRFLQVMAERMKVAAVEEVAADVAGWGARLKAGLRAEGIAPASVERMGDRGLEALTNAVSDPVGQWVLGPRLEAESERALMVEGGRVLRVDRMFVAGERVGEEGSTRLWVVDYKTSEMGGLGEAEFAAAERAKYGAQLAAYAGALDGDLPVMLGLYYPLAKRLVSWAYEPE